jgi:hypothetical protein
MRGASSSSTRASCSVNARGSTSRRWTVSHTFVRRDIEGWFNVTIRPMLVRMVELKGVRGQYSVAADHDGCQRCFVKLSCNPYEGLQKGNLVMAFDLNKLKRDQALVPDPVAVAPVVPEHDRFLETQLTASIVQINRPRPVLIAEPLVVETTGVELVVDPEPEAPAISLREELAAIAEDVSHKKGDISADIEAQALAEATAPKARRGRPRGSKNVATTSAATPPASGAAPGAGATKALYEEAEALATAVQTALDGLDTLRGRFTKTLEELDKRIATLRAGS